jgi:hypothetical protein
MIFILNKFIIWSLRMSHEFFKFEDAVSQKYHSTNYKIT